MSDVGAQRATASPGVEAAAASPQDRASAASPGVFASAASPGVFASAASPPGEEELRFIRNFHDVFLSVGLAMLAAGLAIVSTLWVRDYLAGADDSAWRRATTLVALVAAGDAALMWLLAEVFARGRRLFLPAIVILVAFAGFWFVALACVYALAFLDAGPESLDRAVTELKTLPLFLASGMTAGVFAYYLRMRLPFAMGLGALFLVAALILALDLAAPGVVADRPNAALLAAGLFLFALGVAFDARDPERLTRYSDNGFWLHFFAAPAIFGAVGRMVAGPDALAAGEAFPAAATLAVVGAFAIVSLLINRRALLVSGLLSAAVAISILVTRSGLDGAGAAAATLLLLGGAMVLLGGAWRSVRRVLVAPFPKTGPVARIIPPEPPAKAAEKAE